MLVSILDTCQDVQWRVDEHGLGSMPQHGRDRRSTGCSANESGSMGDLPASLKLLSILLG